VGTLCLYLLTLGYKLLVNALIATSKIHSRTNPALLRAFTISWKLSQQNL